MPYTIDNPPDRISELPKHAQEIWIAAYNSAFEQYDGDEAKANATAWSAVKNKYEQRDGKWVAKESKEEKMPKTAAKEAEMSMEDKRNLLQSALEEKIPSGDRAMPVGAWICDVYDTELVYRQDGAEYKVPYVIDTEGKVTLGEPVKVKRQTVYTPIESLRAVYNDVLMEVGRRNAALDAARIKKIVELCQELLSSEGEEVDEEKAKKATKEAEKALAWLQEQEMAKTEDGVKFPAAAYAYVPDPEKPSTWKLRLWQDLNNKVTRTQLGRAAAALSPGGFRGQKVAIPAEDLPAVKRKIRAEYRKLDVEDEDIPRWVKESESRELVNSFIPLTEATLDSKGKAKLIIIQPGFNATKDRYYPKEVLQRDYKIFEGTKMYADHPTPTEERELPERSIRAWVATLTNVRCDENGIITGEADVIERWLMEKLDLLKQKNQLDKMGISINAVGSATKAKVDGVETTVIERLITARSVDFVTEPGAGGVVTFYEADRKHDIDLIELATLKERRPDLVEIIKSEGRAEIQKEVKHKMELEEKIKDQEEQIQTLTEENTQLKEAQEKAEKEKAIAETKAAVDDAVGKAELPEPAKKRLLESYKDAESTDGLEEAIQKEKDYVAELEEAGKVTNMGGSEPDTEKDKAALREAFKTQHPEWTDAQLDAAVEGR